MKYREKLGNRKSSCQQCYVHIGANAWDQIKSFLSNFWRTTPYLSPNQWSTMNRRVEREPGWVFPALVGSGEYLSLVYKDQQLPSFSPTSAGLPCWGSCLLFSSASSCSPYTCSDPTTGLWILEYILFSLASLLWNVVLHKCLKVHLVYLV